VAHLLPHSSHVRLLKLFTDEADFDAELPDELLPEVDSAGVFLVSVFTLGVFTLGVFTLGVFTLGGFTLGVFTLGVFTLSDMLTLGEELVSLILIE
jgi:hypothetical protein